MSPKKITTILYYLKYYDQTKYSNVFLADILPEPLVYANVVTLDNLMQNTVYCIPVYKYLYENAPKFILWITNMDKRKVWHGDTFTKIIFTTKQRNAKFTKIFHQQNKPVYSSSKFLWCNNFPKFYDNWIIKKTSFVKIGVAIIDISVLKLFTKNCISQQFSFKKIPYTI